MLWQCDRWSTFVTVVMFLTLGRFMPRIKPGSNAESNIWSPKLVWMM